jgi:CheY-like chemotaxis protein
MGDIDSDDNGSKDDGVDENQSDSRRKDVWLNVLIAEDNPLNQKVAAGFVHSLGCASVIVPDGSQVLAELEKQDFDLVLMDIRMPVMGGLEATQQIRQEVPAEKMPKIVALTADAMPGDEERYLDAGMDAYLVKPLHLKTLEDALRRLFP